MIENPNPVPISPEPPGAPHHPVLSLVYRFLDYFRWFGIFVLVFTLSYGFPLFVGWLGSDAFPEGLLILASMVVPLLIYYQIEKRGFVLSRAVRLPVGPRTKPLVRGLLWTFIGPFFVIWYVFFHPQRANEGSPPPGYQFSSEGAGREIVETLVFVLVLVLMLKSFVAEAFVIPTGSMAETLWGYQKVVDCPWCKIKFPVNCSQEVDPQDGNKRFVEECTCPNCRAQIKKMAEFGPPIPVLDPQTGRREFREKGYSRYLSHTGDRVLVAKFLYDLPWEEPKRLEVVVFKFPKKPQDPKTFAPVNYIKRLVGKSGETIAIRYGNLYYLPPEKSPKYDDDKIDPSDRWRTVEPGDSWSHDCLHKDDQRALELFDKKQFSIIRKPPDKILSMSRLVYDNNHPAKDQMTQPRWVGTDPGGWQEKPGDHSFNHAPQGDSLAWLHYRHLLRDRGDKPQLITDFMGYNSWGPQQGPPQEHWVGDLLLECEVTIDKPQGQLVLELSQGTNRYQASWALDSGLCTLYQLKGGPEGKGPLETKELRSAATALKKSGTYRLRLANVDDQLVLWVNGSLPFGADGVAYDPPDHLGPYANDLEPASIGARGAALKVAHLKLWRDTYYTQGNPTTNYDYPPPDDWGDPATWKDMRNLTPRTIYVQPGHYLCMGDNSPASSDGRSWGLVPQRLLLGRALAVYYPFYCPLWPLENPVNRIGAIK